MLHVLNGKIYINKENKTVAKTLFDKLVDKIEKILSDERDYIWIGREQNYIALSFDLRFDEESSRNTIRDWLINRHSYAEKGLIHQHTCYDDENLPCSDVEEALKWGDWVDD